VFWSNGIAGTLSTLAIVIAVFPFIARRRSTAPAA
jgi:hypothetical protein